MAEAEKKAAMLESLLPSPFASVIRPKGVSVIGFYQMHGTRQVRRANQFLRRWKFTLMYLTSAYFIVTYTHEQVLELGPQKKHEVAWTVGGGLVCLTLPLAIYLSVDHLLNFVEPRQQSQTVRIVWTVPVYTVSAWLCLRFPLSAVYVHGVRELYEAYVIYCFLQYLVYYLGENRLELATTLARKPATHGHHKPPFCFLEPWAMGLEFLDNCKFGVLQLVVVRSFTTLGTVLGHWWGVYDEWHGVVLTTVCNSLSQGYALYVLFLFYHATYRDMAAIRPLGKFLTIKAIVFFSYWQGIVIGLLVQRGDIKDLDEGMHSAEMVARGIKDLLVCVEMFVAAIAYLFMFPVSDFVRPTQPASSSSSSSCSSSLASLATSSHGTKEATAAAAAASSSSSSSSVGTTPSSSLLLPPGGGGHAQNCETYTATKDVRAAQALKAPFASGSPRVTDDGDGSEGFFPSGAPATLTSSSSSSASSSSLQGGGSGGGGSAAEGQHSCSGLDSSSSEPSSPSGNSNVSDSIRPPKDTLRAVLRVAPSPSADRLSVEAGSQGGGSSGCDGSGGGFGSAGGCGGGGEENRRRLSHPTSFSFALYTSCVPLELQDDLSRVLGGCLRSALNRCSSSVSSSSFMSNLPR